MASKLMLADMATQSAQQVTQGREQWASFLDTASRLYKYPFPDQILIHAQRPDATACASMDIWNSVMNRRVKRGARGIGLIDSKTMTPRYVFDVSDTEPGRGDSRELRLWKMTDEHAEPVSETLSDIYGDINARDMEDLLKKVSVRIADSYCENGRDDIGNVLTGSRLAESNGRGVDIAFRDTLIESINHALRSRCGLGVHVSKEDFLHISNFDTLQSIYALGTATGSISQQILRNIENSIKSMNMTSGGTHMTEQLTYRKEGDYLIPDLSVPPEPEYPINRFGRMRHRYLKDHREIVFNDLLLSGKLQEHLSEISRTSEERLERMMVELEKNDPPPDKATDQMGWVAHMNSLKHQAEEFILAELVYS